MAVITPGIVASNEEEYKQQIEKIAHFAERIHIDLSDGRFTPNKLVPPESAWWPVGIKADFHVMYQAPDKTVDTILKHKPNLIVIHAEADGHFPAFADMCMQHGTKVGVALLARTPAETILPSLDKIDHVLIFSGKLGSFGGHANLDLLSKIQVLKQHKPSLEIGWDGGVNDRNISQLASGGVEVFIVGGYLQNSHNPERDYNALTRIAEETGTT